MRLQELLGSVLVENFPPGATSEQISAVKMDPQVRQLQDEVTQLQNQLKKYQHQAGTPLYRDAKAILTDRQRQLENRHRKVFAQKFGMTDVQAAEDLASRQAHAATALTLADKERARQQGMDGEKITLGRDAWDDVAGTSTPGTQRHKAISAELRRAIGKQQLAPGQKVDLERLADDLGLAGQTDRLRTIRDKVKSDQLLRDLHQHF